MAREKGMGNLQREKSGRWTMRVAIDGRRYSRSTRTKDRAKAERILQRFLAPLGLGERRLPLADVWREYVKSPNRNELAPSTMRSKQKVWMHFAKWMELNYLCIDDLGGVTAEMVAEYLASLRADLCGSTYNGRVCVLREIFHVLVKKAGIDEDVWDGVRLRPDDSHSRRELTIEEVRRLLEAAEKATGSRTAAERRPSRGGDWKLLFMLGIYTGLRLGDCCRLRWENVNLEAEVIQMIPRKTRRYAHGRPITIPIHPALRERLEKCSNVRMMECSNGREGADGFVMPEIAEMYVAAHWKVDHMVKKIFRAAGIRTSVMLEGRSRATPEATFHSLRHTFVSMSANAGVPLTVIQSIVGHESTAMTRHYYHESADALRRAVAAIPRLVE